MKTEKEYQEEFILLVGNLMINTEYTEYEITERLRNSGYKIEKKNFGMIVYLKKDLMF